MCHVKGADGDFAGGRIRLLFLVEAGGRGAVCCSRIPNITASRVINRPAKVMLTKIIVHLFAPSIFPLSYN